MGLCVLIVENSKMDGTDRNSVIYLSYNDVYKDARFVLERLCGTDVRLSDGAIYQSQRNDTQRAVLLDSHFGKIIFPQDGDVSGFKNSIVPFREDVKGMKVLVKDNRDLRPQTTAKSVIDTTPTGLESVLEPVFSKYDMRPTEYGTWESKPSAFIECVIMDKDYNKVGYTPKVDYVKPKCSNAISKALEDIRGELACVEAAGEVNYYDGGVDPEERTILKAAEKTLSALLSRGVTGV